jgi:hypothetical protein
MPAARMMTLTAVPADADRSPASVASADIRDDWTFEMRGLNGPRRLELVSAPPGWALREIRVNGIDATDRPLPFGRPEQSLQDVEVMLTDRISTVAGTVANDRGAPAAGAVVVVFATDRSRWYPASRFLKTAAADAAGAFTLGGLPFGTYYAAAIAGLPEDDSDGWQDPEFLDALARRASTITVREGERTSIALQRPR